MHGSKFHTSPSEGQWQEDQEHSFHLRSRSSAQAHNPKRLAMFPGRSRRNTTNSTTSSQQSPASSMTSAEAQSSQLSQDKWVPMSALAPAPRQKNVAKSLLSRGSRILRRQESKFNIGAILDEEDEVGNISQKLEAGDFFCRSIRQNDTHEQLKRIVSEPFDFHHLTHTNPAHFEGMDGAHDLVTEFSAICASQIPVTELKGIHAEDIEFYNSPSEDLTDMTNPPLATSLSSPNISRKSPTAKEPRVAENFSRPVSRLNKSLTLSPSIVPPPRLSSMQAISDIPEPTSQVIDEILGLNQPPKISFIDDSVDETTSLERINLVDVFYPDIDHAFTPDENMKPVSTATVINSYLSDSEDVPEEDETNIGHGTTMVGSPLSTLQSLREKDSVPAAVTSKPPAKGQRESSVVPQRLSLLEPLMSPTLPQFHLTLGKPGLQTEDGGKRLSDSKWAVDFEDSLISWDEDIDYCYEHAAESSCDFDWRRNSLEISKDAMADGSETAPRSKPS